MALGKCPDCLNQVSTEAPACPHCGRPIAVARRPAKTARRGIPPWLIVLGVLVAGGAVMSAEQDASLTPAERASRDSARAQDRAELDARVICQMAVRDRLRSPKTADFGSYDATTAQPVAGKLGQWSVTGTVTAVNAFNAPITASWICDANLTDSTASARILE